MLFLKQITGNLPGNLVFFEATKDIPFPIRRIYQVYGVPIGSKRGMHAHKALRQALWCPAGHIDVVVDDGFTAVTHQLDAPDKVLLIFEGQWRDMYWRSEGAVLCVAASDYYDEKDYIRDYDEFLQLVREGYWSHEG